MFSITIALRNSNQIWTLLYKTEESMLDAQSRALTTPAAATHMMIDDDFGQHFTGMHDNIGGILTESLEKSKLAHIELMLHRARVQAVAQQKAATDPAIRSASMGPAIHSPMPGNGLMR